MSKDETTKIPKTTALVKEKERFSTIEDIAKRANVSTATVSRVLNNNPGVRERTRKQVEAAMQEANYVPSAIARGLVNQSNHTLGVLIPDILNPYYSEIIKSIESETTQAGFDLFLCITNEENGRVEYYIDQMIKRRNAGLIILSTQITNRQLLQNAKRSMKLVSVEADIEGVPLLGVQNDEGTEKMVQYLIDLGHRDIAFMGYNYHLSAIKARLDGYKAALESRGLPVRQDLILSGTPSGDPGYHLMKRLLARREYPTAVHCINEYLAAGAFRAIYEAGLRIPEDISLSGFDDLLISKLLCPRLTTVDTSTQALGRAAAEILIQSIMYENVDSDQVTRFPATLVVRESTSGPR